MLVHNNSLANPLEQKLGPEEKKDMGALKNVREDWVICYVNPDKITMRDSSFYGEAR